MVTKTLIVTSVILSFSVGTLQGDVKPSSWIGSDVGLWSIANNWYPHKIPNNNMADNFVVTINTTERTRIKFTEDITISQLDCYGNVDLEVGEHCLHIEDINDFTKNGFLTNYGTLQISGKGVEHEIDADIINKAEMFVTNEVEFYSFINSGNTQIYKGMIQCLGNDLENKEAGIIKGCGLIISYFSIRNQGKIQAKGGVLLLHSFASITNTGVLENTALSSLHIQTVEDVNNHGTIEINAGGGVAFDCNLVNEPNAVITLLNGTLAAITITQKADATLKGFGGITGDIIIEPNALVELIGPTNIVGNMTIGEGAILDISNGTVLVTGDLTCDNGIIQTTNGTIIILGKESGFCERKIIDVVMLTDGPNE